MTDPDSFDDRFKRLSLRVETVMIALIVGCFFLLVAGEVLLEFESLRSFLVETDRLERLEPNP